jgi:hypothetical protein
VRKKFACQPTLVSKFAVPVALPMFRVVASVYTLAVRSISAPAARPGASTTNSS